MNKRVGACCILLVLGLVLNLIAHGQVNPPRKSKLVDSKTTRKADHSEKATAPSHAAIAHWSQRIRNPSPPVAQIGFGSAIDIPLGGFSSTPAFPAVLGDFNGDGIKDIASVAKTNTGTGTVYSISVALGTGGGGFTSGIITTPPVPPAEADPIFVGDLNGDHIDDIVMLHQSNMSLNVQATYEAFLANSDGSGTFTSQGLVPIMPPGNLSPVVWATLAYVSPDNNLDIVVADPGNIWTLLGNGLGSFVPESPVAFSGQLSLNSPVAFADFNGDGTLDFAAADATTNQIMLYLGIPGGGYNTPVPLATPDSFYHSCFVGSGNLSSASGPPDIVTANCNDGNVTVFKNTGGGAFSTGTYYPAGPYPNAVSIADINGDGAADIVSSNHNSGDVTILFGNGDGTLQNFSVGYATGGSPRTPALVADFNLDGKADVVVPDNEYSFAYLQGYGDGSFRSAIDYYSPINPFSGNVGTSIAAGDFNGDGIPDFVIGNCCDSAVGITVFLSNLDGTMREGANYGSGGNLEYVAVADFDGDGKLDIAVTEDTGSTPAVLFFKGNGDGTFAQTGAPFNTDAVAGTPLGMIAGDFNNDGKPDLAVVNDTGTNGDVGILINNGLEGFTLSTNYPLSSTAINLTTIDLNHDKNLDLVVPLSGGSAVAVLLGKGDGSFTAQPDFALVNNGVTYENPYAIAAGDLNGDGKADLAITISDPTTFNQGIAIALGNGDGTFQTPTLLASTLQSPADSPSPTCIQIADLDGDGNLDLIYNNSQFGSVGVLYGHGDGSFHDPVEFPSSWLDFGVVLADVNSDGALDAVTPGGDFAGVTVLLNTGGNLTTLTSSSNPSVFGTSVTFTATVTPTIRGVMTIPTGNVSFRDGSTILATRPVDPSGVAALTATTLTAGSHSITAQYTGSTALVPTISALLTQVVVAPDYTLSANPTSANVTRGSSTTFTITLTPSNNYNGTVTFACGTQLPAGVTCSFKPDTLTPTNTQAVQTVLTVSTMAPVAALAAPPRVKTQDNEPMLWASLSEVGLFGLVLVSELKKRNHRRLMVALGIIAVLLLFELAGCGGGSSSAGGGGTGGTPTGSATIQITATGTAGSNGGSTAPHPISVTINVQ